MNVQNKDWLSNLASRVPLEQILRYALIFIIILNPASVFVKKLCIPLWGVPVIKYSGGLEHFNPTCRWQVGQFRLDGIASLRFAFGKSAASPHARTKPK